MSIAASRVSTSGGDSGGDSPQGGAQAALEAAPAAAEAAGGGFAAAVAPAAVAATAAAAAAAAKAAAAKVAAAAKAGGSPAVAQGARRVLLRLVDPTSGALQWLECDASELVSPCALLGIELPALEHQTHASLLRYGAARQQQLTLFTPLRTL